MKEVTSSIYVDCIYRSAGTKTYEEVIAACTGITSEFSKGDIVTFGYSKEEYEIREAKVLNDLVKNQTGNFQRIVPYKGTEFKISPKNFDIIMSGSGNIQGIVLKKAVGFIISPGMRVSVVR